MAPVKGLLLGCGWGEASSCLGPRTHPVPDRSPVSVVQAVADVHGSFLGRQGADRSLGLESQHVDFHRLREGRGKELSWHFPRSRLTTAKLGNLAWVPAGGGGILTYHTAAGQGGSNTRHSV